MATRDGDANAACGIGDEQVERRCKPLVAHFSCDVHLHDGERFGAGGWRLDACDERRPVRCQGRDVERKPEVTLHDELADDGADHGFDVHGKPQHRTSCARRRTFEATLRANAGRGANLSFISCLSERIDFALRGVDVRRIGPMLSIGAPMHGEHDMVEVTLRPVVAGEALYGFERDDADATESDCQRPQLRYAPSEPRGVMLVARRDDCSARLGFGLLRPIEGAHALVEGELCVGAMDSRRRAAHQEHILDALIQLARSQGSRRLRLKMRTDQLAEGPWTRLLLVAPAVHISGATATVEFPVAAYLSRRSGSGAPSDLRPSGGWGGRGVPSAA